MKRIILLSAAVLLTAALFISSTPIKDCKCKGIPLFGKVKVVGAGAKADFLVHITSERASAKLRVKSVSRTPSKCGEWEFVDSSSDADFRVRFVDASRERDFTICFVERNQGD
ncbi:MAG: hypothetical protein LBJ17_01655 [Dysgonamonadaceae bacterium]|nr:hypothetical protein [Dysgonamonadaceae bacterium]